MSNIISKEQLKELPETKLIGGTIAILDSVSNVTFKTIDKLNTIIEKLKETKLKSEGDVQILRNELTNWKADYKVLETQIKAIFKPAYDFKKAGDTKIKAISDTFEILKTLAEDKILKFLDKQETKGNVIEIKGTQTYKVVVVKHYDKSKVPAQYLELNRDMVEKDILEGKKIDGITFEIIEETRIRG